VTSCGAAAGATVGAAGVLPQAAAASNAARDRIPQQTRLRILNIQCGPVPAQCVLPKTLLGSRHGNASRWEGE
jgi:hypothetical protein